MSKAICKSLLVDTNVWISYFLDDDPSHHEAVSFMEEAARRNVTLLYTPTSLKDVFYIIPRRLRRQFANEGCDLDSASFAPQAWSCVEWMTEMAVAAHQALPECHMAWMLRKEHPDFEDNLVFAAAETSGADYVITYDKALLEHLGPSCITPVQALVALRVGNAAQASEAE